MPDLSKRRQRQLKNEDMTLPFLARFNRKEILIFKG